MNKIFATSCFLLFIALFSIDKAEAQQRFKAGLVFGLNASQIRGDEFAGYKKLGLHGGLRATAMLKDKMDLIIEMLYSQRGSFQRLPNNPDGDMKINLQYAEVPIMLSYKDWYIEEEDFYKVQAIAGFSYGRLIEATAVASFHDTEVEKFNVNDYSFTVGADVFLTKHFAIGSRWTRSINLLYNNKKHNENLDGLIGYFLSFRGMYVF